MKITKLSQEVINQIAAGEVIERPASLVKELIDNSVDAGATHVRISLGSGGIKSIEVADNGNGIPTDQVEAAFDAHSTSKLEKLEDLNHITTMGFRGEALSTIAAVSEVEVTSKTEEGDSYKVTFDGIVASPPKPAPRDRGTTIRADNLFSKIPARFKFLKTPETEYSKCMQSIYPYLLLHPEIHFEVYKDGKRVYNLPITPVEENGLSNSRVSELFTADKDNAMIPLYYEGSGVSISGLIAHPSTQSKRSSKMHVFINHRPINDRGIIRATLEGYGGYIPHGHKVSFIININLRNELVDINVHPRKEEVRFINPYRIYSAVEKSVSDALSRELKDQYVPYQSYTDSNMDSRTLGYSRLRDSSLDQGNRNATQSYGNSPELGGAIWSQQSLDMESDTQNELIYENQPTPIDLTPNRAFQVFLKYLIAEFDNELWVIDQHAAAERITFEKLKGIYNSEPTDIQNLLVEDEVMLSDEESIYLSENIEFFKKIGFTFRLEDRKLMISSVPTIFIGADYRTMFDQIFQLSDDQRDMDRGYEDAINAILAVMACHSSIRTKDKLHPPEIDSIIKQLFACENPYSCPHGRPIVWKMSVSDIDKNFLRTY